MAINSIADLTQKYEALSALVDDLRNDGLTGVNFETNVEEGDCVYLDTTTNTFRRCLANSPTVPEREKFHGIAHFPDGEENFVRIYGFDSGDEYKIYDESDVENPVLLQAFEPGKYVYISSTAAGAYTQTDNDSPVGVAVGIDQLLLASELDNASGAVRQLITNALTQNVITYESDYRDDGKVYTTLKERLDAILSVIKDQDITISELDDEVMLNTDEIETARGSESSLNGRFSSQANRIALLEQELGLAAGSLTNLTSRLAVSINDDGTLKTAVSASTYSTETATATRTGTTTFTLPGNLTAVYESGRALRFNDTILAHVLTSAYTTVTTVTTVTAVVPASIAKVEYSFSPAELPLLAHSQLRDIETVDPTQTDTTRTKHVSDNDLKTLQDQITDNDNDISNINSNISGIKGAEIAVPAGAIMLFGQASSPVGWTKITAWQNNAMITINTDADGSALGSGGSVNPQSAHNHTSASHNHGPGSLQFRIGSISSGSLNLYDGSSTFTLGIFKNKDTNYQVDGDALLEASFGDRSIYTDERNSQSGTTDSTTPDNTGDSSVPYYQEVIACSKDAY